MSHNKVWNRAENQIQTLLQIMFLHSLVYTNKHTTQGIVWLSACGSSLSSADSGAIRLGTTVDVGDYITRPTFPHLLYACKETTQI